MATKKCTSCGKMKKMAKGGNPCPEGYYWGPNGDCLPQAKKPGLLAGNSAKVGVAALSAIGAGMGAAARATSAKANAKRDLKKKVDETAKKITSNVMKKGGEKKAMLAEAPVLLMKKGGSNDKNWIQKAVNPKHKGYCTPMSKPTCTPKRAALARTFKKMAKNK
tara:strand:+ start:2501 stop:2992 length:492 start_codon:yes stop_codon:yes gene_type:complete